MRKLMHFELDKTHRKIIATVDGIQHVFDINEKYSDKMGDLFRECNPPIYIGKNKYEFRYHGAVTLLKDGCYVSMTHDLNRLDMLYDIVEQIKKNGYNYYIDSIMPKVTTPVMPDMSNISSYGDLVDVFNIKMQFHGRDDKWRFTYRIDNYIMYSEWDGEWYDAKWEKRQEYIVKFFETAILRRPLVAAPPSFVNG